MNFFFIQALKRTYPGGALVIQLICRLLWNHVNAKKYGKDDLFQVPIHDWSLSIKFWASARKQNASQLKNILLGLLRDCEAADLLQLPGTYKPLWSRYRFKVLPPSQESWTLSTDYRVSHSKMKSFSLNKNCTVKLGNKERFGKEQIVIKEPFTS